MTITTTALGANTTQITLSGETSVANFITALDTAITNGGWTQYDVSNQYNRIYSSVNADGSTYKLIGITIDPGTLKISTTSYELWNTTTHVGTNETFTFNRAGTMGIAFSLCDVLVMVSSKWLVLQSFIRNEPSCWSGVFEVAREAVEDTAANGVPCWCWVSSATIFSTAGTARPFVSFPRTAGGLTGSNAVISTANLGLQMPYVKLGGNLGAATTSLTNFVSYAWNSNNRIVQSARPCFGISELHGTMFGLKFTYNIGNPYNTVSVPIDSNFNYSAIGTNTPHWILGAAPTSAPTNVLTTNGAIPSGYAVSNSVAVSGSTAGAVCAVPVGPNWYSGTTSGVVFVDGTGTTLLSLGVITGTTLAIYDIKYDNVRYVYASTATGIYQIDTQNNNAVVFLAITNGVGSLHYDGTNLWAARCGSIVSNTVYQINLSNFTVAATIPLTNTGAAFIGGMCTDNAGNLYVVTTECILYKVVISTSVVSKLTAAIGQSAYPAGIYFNGNQLLVVSGYASVAYYYYYTTSGTLLQSNTFTSSTSAAVQGSAKVEIGKLGIYDFQTCNYGPSGGGIAVGTFTNGALSLANTYTQQFNCDGNRGWACVNNILYVYTNLFHADETTTTYGRMLLPK
jgi:hypothetical protein